MSNTIEKALKRKQQQEQLKQQESAQNSSPDVEAAVEATPVESKVHTEESTTEAPITEPKSSVSTTSLNTLEIDLVDLEDRGFVSVSSSRKVINEEFREIKRKLLQTAFGPISKTLNNPNIIMVTSARPSEGKTFTAVNLAISIAAEQDKTVLLVDADVLRPNVLRTIKCKAENGLMEYLLGEVDDLSDVILKTNIDKLRIIPAGKSHHLSTELLASSKMSETINEFSTRYSDRIVIIDTPPIIGINESAVLANFAGQAVVVCEEGRASLADVRNAVMRLNEDIAVGFVVNKSIQQDSDGAGYYGYYYSSERD